MVTMPEICFCSTDACITLCRCSRRSDEKPTNSGLTNFMSIGGCAVVAGACCAGDGTAPVHASVQVISAVANVVSRNTFMFVSCGLQCGLEPAKWKWKPGSRQGATKHGPLYTREAIASAVRLQRGSISR